MLGAGSITLKYLILLAKVYSAWECRVKHDEIGSCCSLLGQVADIDRQHGPCHMREASDHLVDRIVSERNRQHHKQIGRRFHGRRSSSICFLWHSVQSAVHFVVNADRTHSILLWTKGRSGDTRRR